MNTNLRNRFFIRTYFILIFSTVWITGLFGQSGYTRPPLTGQWKTYREQVASDSNKRMVELKSLVPGLRYDLRYATKNNFVNRLMYPADTRDTYLRLPAAKALKKVDEELKKLGLGLKVYDAYRPYSVTVKFWELVRDERYVANPSKGSGHNRGIAVDLTLVNRDTGEELDMGTQFDNFSDTAHHTFKALPERVIKNRELLRGLMEKNGFKALVTEWWHYYMVGGDRFEVLDIEFKKFRKDPS